jgi:hypothetical protein
MAALKCPYCIDIGRGCGATEQKPIAAHGHWHCTRGLGHEGPHIACGAREHVLHEWMPADV